MMESEVTKSKEVKALELQNRWTTQGILKLEEPLVVHRGTNGERGFDSFTLTSYDQQSNTIFVTKAMGTSRAEKTMNWPEIYALNNPVKSLGEWAEWYQRTTGEKPNIGLLANRKKIIDIREFQQQYAKKGLHNQTWQETAATFERNLDRIELPDKVEALIKQNLLPGELPRDKTNFYGRRIIPVDGLIFEGRTFAPTYEAAERIHDQEWRAYLQVEIDDIPRMVEILNEMGAKMSQENEVLDFKFLIAKTDPKTVNIKPGVYPDLKDGDPRIAVYFPDGQKRFQFIQRLTSEYYQDMVEMSKRRAGKARRPGSSVSYDPRTGLEFRHINVLDQAGHSNEVAKDPNWRNRARGEFTRLQETI